MPKRASKTARKPARKPAPKRKTAAKKKPAASKKPAAAKKPATSVELADQQHPRALQIMLVGKVYTRVPFKPDDPTWLCIDCEAADGQVHELGCDAENCPRCGGQLIGCGCLPIPD